MQQVKFKWATAQSGAERRGVWVAEPTACFLNTKWHKEKLSEAMKIFFVKSPTVGGDDNRTVGEIIPCCQDCQENNMTLKKKKPSRRFLVDCQNFPFCKNVMWLPRWIFEAFVNSQLGNTCKPSPVYKDQFEFIRMEIHSLSYVSATLSDEPVSLTQNWTTSK